MADRGYTGIGHEITTPIMANDHDPQTGALRRRELCANQKAYNSTHARLRAHGERANAQLKSWKALTRVRCSPEQTTPLLAAITTLITAGQPRK